jgi:hypothetical protein
VPQFVIEAETEQDRLLLGVVAMFPMHAKGKWEFTYHGYTRQSHFGIVALNFGWKSATGQGAGADEDATQIERGVALFQQFYPLAQEITETYAPGEIGLTNRLATEFAKVAELMSPKSKG